MQNLFVLPIFLMHVIYVLSYPSGAPNHACANMFPQHTADPPQAVPSPFHVELSQYTYKPRETIQVTLKSNLTGRFFEGFLMQMRKASLDNTLSQELVGSFLDQNEARAICDGKGGMTQNYRLSGDLTTTWIAPEISAGDLEVRVTFVENFNTFWFGLASPILREAQETSTTTTTTTTTTSTTTTPTTTTTITTTTTTPPTTTPPTTTTPTTTTLPTTTVTLTTTSTVKSTTGLVSLTTKPSTPRVESTTKSSLSDDSSKKTHDHNHDHDHDHDHVMIGSMSFEITTVKEDKKTGDNSGIVLHPSTLIISGLVCLSALFRNLS